MKYLQLLNNINFIDMRKYFSNFEENKFYAKSGPHLSPFGSKLVAKKIADEIK